MKDSWRPRKLEPGLAAQYSMPSDLMTSTMKSEPGRALEVTSTAGAVSGFRAACWARAMGAVAARPAAAPAPLRNPRRSVLVTAGLFESDILASCFSQLSLCHGCKCSRQSARYDFPQ